MSTLRKDPISGHCVIIAADRARRPHQLRRTETRIDSIVCPFCEGQEASTTGEVFAFRVPSSSPDSPGWRVRVIPNKYPALDEGMGNGETMVSDSDPMFPTGSTGGIHEIIIETAERSSMLMKRRWPMGRPSVLALSRTGRRNSTARSGGPSRHSATNRCGPSWWKRVCGRTGRGIEALGIMRNSTRKSWLRWNLPCGIDSPWVDWL